MWRGVIREYWDFLPIRKEESIITLLEGNTPLIPSSRIKKEVLSGIDLYFKYEGLNPTGSFKDRGMTVAVSMAKEMGSKALICASTGNTSASAAAYAAKAGMKAYVLIPEGHKITSEGNIIGFQLDTKAGCLQRTPSRVVPEGVIPEDREVGDFTSRIETFRDCPDQTDLPMFYHPIHMGCSCHHQRGFSTYTLNRVISHSIPDNDHIFRILIHFVLILKPKYTKTLQMSNENQNL